MSAGGGDAQRAAGGVGGSESSTSEADKWIFEGQALLDRGAAKSALEAFDKAAHCARQPKPGESAAAKRKRDDLVSQATLGRANALRETHRFDACRDAYSDIVERLLLPQLGGGSTPGKGMARGAPSQWSEGSGTDLGNARGGDVEGVMARLLGCDLPLSAAVLPFVIAALVVQTAPRLDAEEADDLPKLLKLVIEESDSTLATFDEDGEHMVHTLYQCAACLRDRITSSTKQLDESQLNMLARALSGLGSVAFALGELDAGQRAYAACLVLAVKTGDITAQMSSHCNLGNALSSARLNPRMPLIAFQAALASVQLWAEVEKADPALASMAGHRVSSTATLHLNIANSYVRTHQATEREPASASGVRLSQSPADSNLGRALHHFRLAEELAISVGASGVLKAIWCSLSNIESPADGGVHVRKLAAVLREEGREPPRECGICLGDINIPPEQPAAAARADAPQAGRDERLHIVGGCMHIFHAQCLNRWLNASAGMGGGTPCPSCQLHVQTGVQPAISRARRPPLRTDGGDLAVRW